MLTKKDLGHLKELDDFMEMMLRDICEQEGVEYKEGFFFMRCPICGHEEFIKEVTKELEAIGYDRCEKCGGELRMIDD